MLRTEFPAIGTTATIVVQAHDDLVGARRALQDVVDAVDVACSRFRPDSEIMRLARAAGAPVHVSGLLWDALQAAHRAYVVTGGLLDPTVGDCLIALGYDRDFAELAGRRFVGRQEPLLPAGWPSVRLDPARHTVSVPPGLVLDLGATAKALAVDRAADRIAEQCSHGVLVGIGGDLVVAGSSPVGGWAVKIAESHRAPAEVPGPVVALHDGALATSSTAVRRWGRHRHHIVDPATGGPVSEVWRTVSVAAATCLDANIASTAAILRGEEALAWLEELRLPARLVRPDGTVTVTGCWPVRLEAA